MGVSSDGMEREDEGQGPESSVVERLRKKRDHETERHRKKRGPDTERHRKKRGPDTESCPAEAMDTSLKSEEPCPNPPPYFLPGGASPPRQRFVQHYESELGDSPGLIRCPSCQNQVMSDVTHHAGTFSWTMCLVFILCGLFLGCCLIPFFLRSFKDAYHTCPRCRMVLHIHRKSCCPMTSDPSSLTPRLGSGHPDHA